MTLSIKTTVRLCLSMALVAVGTAISSNLFGQALNQTSFLSSGVSYLTNTAKQTLEKPFNASLSGSFNGSLSGYFNSSTFKGLAKNLVNNQIVNGFSLGLSPLKDLMIKFEDGQFVPILSGDLIIDVHRLADYNNKLSNKYLEFMEYVKVKGGNITGDEIKQLFNNDPLFKYMLSKTCFEKLGCFQAVGHSYYKIYFLPMDPKQLNVTFYLFTDGEPYYGRAYQFDFNDTLLQFFDPNGVTIFITHGYLDYYSPDNWNERLKNHIFINDEKKTIKNVFIVDWSRASRSNFYHLALSHVKLVSEIQRYFIEKLHNKTGLRFQNIHLIGHSLGAQIAGMTAMNFLNPKISTITALDPAGPGFYSKTIPRLNRDSAHYVKVIHTDAGNSLIEGFGIYDQLGDVDFYPNGGNHQEGCANQESHLQAFASVAGMVSCGHHRAIELVSDHNYQNDECFPVGYACRDYGTFLEGRCANCGNESIVSCLNMNIQYEKVTDDPNKFQQQDYYFVTAGKNPFFVFHYQVVFRRARSSPYGNFTVSGSLRLTIEATDHRRLNVYARIISVEFLEGAAISFLLVTRSKLGIVNRMNISFTEDTVFMGTLKRIGNRLTIGQALLDKPISWLDQRVHLMTQEKTIDFDFIEINYMSHTDLTVRLNNSAVLCPLGVFSDANNSTVMSYTKCPPNRRPARRGYQMSSDELVALSRKHKYIKFSPANRRKFIIYN